MAVGVSGHNKLTNRSHSLLQHVLLYEILFTLSVGARIDVGLAESVARSQGLLFSLATLRFSVSFGCDATHKRAILH
jgi:hypothetical protein